MFSRGPLGYTLPKLKRKERAAWDGEWDLKSLCMRFSYNFSILNICTIVSFFLSLKR